MVVVNRIAVPVVDQGAFGVEIFLLDGETADLIRELVARMDAVDAVRNEILSEGNALLRSINDPEFDLIEPSRHLIRKWGFGFDQAVVEAL